MLISRDGFGWVVGDHEVASRSTVEMLLSRDVPSEAVVGELTDVAASCGGSVVVAPGGQPSGTWLWPPIPTATSGRSSPRHRGQEPPSAHGPLRSAALVCRDVRQS